METGLRTAWLHDGRRLLGNLFNDPTLPLAADQSGPGEKCTPAVEREIATLFGPLLLRRNYYHAAATGRGRYPLDEALQLAGPYTPALARLMSRAGAQTGFESGSADLRIYAGLTIQGRPIHRLMQTIGPAVLRAMEAAPADTPAAPIPVLYVEVAGTGAPMVPAALAGRKGKQPDGTAKTREVKLGGVFTQHATPKASPCATPPARPSCAAWKRRATSAPAGGGRRAAAGSARASAWCCSATAPRGSGNWAG